MDLLKAMLEREPEKRISSEAALQHPAFHSLMSKSPLIMKHTFNADSLIKHQNAVGEWPNQSQPQGQRQHPPGSPKDPGPDRGHVATAESPPPRQLRRQPEGPSPLALARLWRQINLVEVILIGGVSVN